MPATLHRRVHVQQGAADPFVHFSHAVLNQSSFASSATIIALVACIADFILPGRVSRAGLCRAAHAAKEISLPASFKLHALHASHGVLKVWLCNFHAWLLLGSLAHAQTQTSLQDMDELSRRLGMASIAACGRGWHASRSRPWLSCASLLAPKPRWHPSVNAERSN